MPYVRRMASQRTPLYHYRVKDKIVGPICLTDLHALLVSKKILPDTMIREEHSQCWMPGAPGAPQGIRLHAFLPPS